MWKISFPQDRTELDDPTLQFRHENLNDSEMIRLMELLPGAWEDDLQCHVHTVNMNALPAYDALSYSWGEDLQDNPSHATDLAFSLVEAIFPTERFLRCNGKILPVSTNLYNALRRLRDKPSVKYLWIDRVCIDQSNPLERNDQVRKMDRIYSGARLVVIWLGEEDDRTVPAFSMIEKVSELATASAVRSLHTNTDEIFNPDALQALGLPSFPSMEWESMHRLFERRWFQRSWVVQEVALADVAIAVCGCRILNWDDIGCTGQYLVASGFFRAMQDVYGRQGRPTLASSIQNNRAAVKLSTDRSLTVLLCSMRRFKATDPRDKVFSLLGLSRTKKQQDSHGKADTDAIDPDYSLSTDVIFRQVTEKLMKQKFSLALLSTVEDLSLRKTPNLPSWVPDYAVWQEVTILGMPDNPHNYHAGGEEVALQNSSEFEGSDHVLSLAGYEVDAINEIGLCLNSDLTEGSLSNVLLSWLKLVDKLPETYVNGESKPEAIWRTFIGNLGGSTHPAHSIYAKHFLAFLHYHLSDEKGTSNVTSITNAVHNTRAGSDAIKAGNRYLYGTSFMYIAGLRRFFVTRSGYMGLGPNSMQRGDKVFVFPGGDVPFVLRASETGRYRLVGEAYVHGMMNGEALNNTSRVLMQVDIE